MDNNLNLVQSASSTSHRVVNDSNSNSVPLWQHVMAIAVPSIMVDGLAKIFNFEVLRHGTSLTNYISILQNGADPARGGSGSTVTYTGGANTSDFALRTHGHFYVFKDSETNQGMYQRVESGKLVVNRESPYEAKMVFESYYEDQNRNKYEKQQYRELTLVEKIENMLAPSFHAAMTSNSTSLEENGRLAAAKNIVRGLFNFTFTPTLKFIYPLNDIPKIFEHDPDYAGKAYMTSHALPNNKIGLIGICSQASLQSLKEGLRERPYRVLTGAAQVLTGGILMVGGTLLALKAMR